MPQKYALLIGNGKYEDENIPGLSKPPQNVTDLVEVLTDPDIGGFEADNVETLINHPHSTISRAIARFFAKRKRDDLLLLYYAGHGLLDERNQLYLAVQDTDSDSDLLSVTTIPTTFITDLVGKSRAKQQILILDCCHSGAFKAASKGAAGATVVVLTASDATEFAWEDEESLGELEHTVFTHHLIQGLKTGQADTDRNGTITSNELYDYIQAKMEASKQNPQRLLPFGRFEHDTVIAKATPVIVDPDLLHDHYFISYAPTDGDAFATAFRQALAAANVPAWLDSHDAKGYGPSMEEQIVEAIETCAGVLFVVTADSVQSYADNTMEWTRALKFKKPVIPIRLKPDAELPFRLANRQAIDFGGAASQPGSQQFETSLTQLRQHLHWLNTPEGQLRQLKDRLTDASRDLRATRDPQQRSRIEDDIAQLKRQVEAQEKVVADPQAAAERVKASIASGLERERQPEKPVRVLARSKFINPPPDTVPTYFQDRFEETKLVGDFLQDRAQRLMIVTGRGGIGKTAMVVRLLKSLENGQLPDDGGSFQVGGIVYLSASGSRQINFPNLYADLGKLLSPERAQELDDLYKNPQVSTQAKMETLLAEFPPAPTCFDQDTQTPGGDENSEEAKAASGPVVLLLDNFEDVVDPETRGITDSELDEALQTILTSPPHVVKAIITTRIAPRDLQLLQSQYQMPLPLDQGLESPYAENILREKDADGKFGLKHAPDELLKEAKERTRGYPRALEALFAILVADRDTTLPELLANDDMFLPENVVEVLVGEAFNRLDATAQKVMQALAIYARPVTPTALDYLLEPYLPGVDTALVLSRLVNMQFVRKETGRYYLHAVDRAYALARVPQGEKLDQKGFEDLFDLSPPFTQFALYGRGAEYFRQARKPRAEWKTLDDLAPQLAEFDLRCAGQEYDTAANVLLEIDYDYLLLWGHYRQMVELHERLLGRLDDPRLRCFSLNSLGSAHYVMGQIRKAILCYEQALTITRDRKDRLSEGRYLGNLGNAHSALGEEGRAIKYYEQALTIHREFGDRLGEGNQLGNLAEVLINEGRYAEAIQHALESIKIGKEINSPVLGSAVNTYLALAHLYAGDLPAAYAAAQAARQHDVPRYNHYTLALLGVIALRQGEPEVAREAFAAAITQTDGLLAHTARNYDALDSKGLALCGLALCGRKGGVTPPLQDAVAAYRAARAITCAPGIVGRVLRLLDALAVMDETGLLAPARAAAAGSDIETR